MRLIANYMQIYCRLMEMNMKTALISIHTATFHTLAHMLVCIMFRKLGQRVENPLIQPNMNTGTHLYWASRGQRCSSGLYGRDNTGLPPPSTAKKCTCWRVQGQSAHSAQSFISLLWFTHLLPFSHMHNSNLFFLFFIMSSIPLISSPLSIFY